MQANITYHHCYMGAYIHINIYYAHIHMKSLYCIVLLYRPTQKLGCERSVKCSTLKLQFRIRRPAALLMGKDSPQWTH